MLLMWQRARDKETPYPGKRGKSRVDAFLGNKHVTLVILSSCGRCAAVLHSSQVPHNVSRKTSVQFKLELRKDFWTIWRLIGEMKVTSFDFEIEGFMCTLWSRMRSTLSHFGCLSIAARASARTTRSLNIAAPLHTRLRVSLTPYLHLLIYFFHLNNNCIFPCGLRIILNFDWDWSTWTGTGFGT